MSINNLQLDQIETLLAQSMNGIHLLFDHREVAQVLRTPTEEMDFFSFDNIRVIQDLFSGLIASEGVWAKRSFLASLDKEQYEILMRTYFHILDNSVLETLSYKH